jgi:DNA-binding XRE family transcriptional regulator
MLPFCERHVMLPRTDVSPVWTRSWPIAKEPKTLGEHLKKKRFMAGLRQKETAVKLGVSSRTLSLWECDRIYPAWVIQPRLVAYLGYDPFTETGLKNSKSNETSGVAFLSSDVPVTIGQKIRHFRLKSRKARKQLATEWGISVKTLYGWETNRHQPSALCRKRMAGFESLVSTIGG